MRLVLRPFGIRNTEIGIQINHHTSTNQFRYFIEIFVSNDSSPKFTATLICYKLIQQIL